MTRNIFGRVAAVAAVVASAVVAQPASAQFGQLNIVGSVDVFQGSGGAGNLVIDFQVPQGLPTGTVTAGANPGDQTGVFAGIAGGTPGTQTDLVFNFGVGAPPAETVPPFTLLTLGGFTFTVNSFALGNTGTPVNLTQVGNAVFATITANGTVTGPGLTGPTAFAGAYSTQFPGTTVAALTTMIDNGGTIQDKSFSATFTISAIPEPATVTLMGAGLVALLGVGYRRRTTV